MTELAPYPEYKDSGVEWLGQTPSHWGRAQLRRVATIVNGGTPTPDEAHWGGSVAWATPVDLNAVDGHTIKSTLRTLTMEGLASGSALVPSGSIILSTRAPIGYSAMTRSPVAFNQGCKGLILTGNIDSRFMLVTVLAAKAELARCGQGTTFLELSSSALGSVNVPLAPLEEQLAIADFVERETAGIDAFIADQEELIELLTERRAATITHAVTKGLDPSAPMKDSGVRWWGFMPSKWQVRRLKEIVSTAITDGPHETPEIYAEGDVLFVSAEAIGSGRLNLRRARGYISFEDDARFARKYRPRRNDIFMVKSGATTGTVAIVDTDTAFNIWSPLAAIRCGALASPRFVMYCMKSSSFRESVELHWSFGTQQNIGMGVVGNLTIPLPSREEQTHIADYLDRETAELDATIADARQAIALSKERRSALISAAVTGKIDLRTVA